MSRYRQFDRTSIMLKPIRERGHGILAHECALLPTELDGGPTPDLRSLATAIVAARRDGRPVVLFMGAHLIKLGLSRFVIDLVERGVLTHVATNGAGLIHDFELATLGGTSEDVAQWIRVGQFGLWDETSRINVIVANAQSCDEGFGEAIGREIEQGDGPHRSLSIAAACWRAGVPMTGHVTIGADIHHGMANCDGAALGQVSYTDFLIFAESVRTLERGVLLNVGSAVTGPEVFLKALSMSRNVGKDPGHGPSRFTTAVFDLISLPEHWRHRLPANKEPLYYYRPWKSLLVRAVNGGGSSFYIQGNLTRTIPLIWQTLA